MAWAVREKDPSRNVILGGSQGFTFVGPSGYGSVSPADDLATLLASGAIPRQVPLDAIRVGEARQGTRNVPRSGYTVPEKYEWRTAGLRLRTTWCA